MKFDKSFFAAEIVDDFYIRPMVKRAWGAQLVVLEKISEICERHNIHYYAEYGTLLGAIRHKGFIPWDDDMDIGMLREDFEIFMKYAPDELPEGYLLLDVHRYAEYDTLITRIVNTDSININPDFMEMHCGCPYSAGIDIFVCDNIPDDLKERDAHRQLFYAVWGLAQAWNNPTYDVEERNKNLKEICKLTGAKINKNGNVVNQLYVLADEVAKMYRKVRTNEVAVMGSYAKDPNKHIPYSCVSEIVEVPFESFGISVPKEYEYVLDHRYKNYRIPKKRSQVHDYPFFREQEMMLGDFFRENNIEIPENFDYIQHNRNRKTKSILFNKQIDFTADIFNDFALEVRLDDLADYLNSNNIAKLKGIRLSVHFLQLAGVASIMKIAHTVGAEYIVVEMDNCTDSATFDEFITSSAEIVRKDDLIWFLQNGYIYDESGMAHAYGFSDARWLRETVSAYNMFCGRDCFGVCLSTRNIEINDLAVFFKIVQNNIGLVCVDTLNKYLNIHDELAQLGYDRSVVGVLPDTFSDASPEKQDELLKVIW